MALPGIRDGADRAGSGELPALSALLADVTRAVTGLMGERELFDAAMSVVGRSRTRGMVLTRPEGRSYMEAVSLSMGGVLAQTVHNLTGSEGRSFQFELDGTPVLRRALAGLPTQLIPVPELCRELFGSEAAPRVIGLVGGPSGQAGISPLRCGHAVVGALVLSAPAAEKDILQSTDAIGASLSAALTLARVVRRVDRVRALLPARHSARRALREAIELAEVRQPDPHFFVPQGGGHPSLVPYRLMRTTAPPPMPDEPSAPPSGRTVSASAFETDGDARASVLLVEDERRLRESTSALLSGLGYRVEAVASGEEAVTAFSRSRDRGDAFDVVLMDETLGGNMRGTEALRILQRLQPEVRAIQLSGLTDRTGTDELKRQGFVGGLSKPVSMEQLNHAIEAALLQRAPGA